MTTKYTIGIVIVTYNSQKDIRACLKSIYESTYKTFDIFVIDNNSTDKTVDLVREKYPKVAIYSMKKNLGFATGNNYGIKKALEGGCKNIFLLNPDTIIDKECLSKLRKASDGETILQPIVLIHNGKKKTDIVNTSGGVLNFLGFSYCGNYLKNRNIIKKDQDIALASGAAMFIPGKIFKKIGFFDDSFFMYHEDVDLSYRARLADINIRLIPDALVWHKYSFSKNKQKYYHFEKNRILFLYRNFSLKYLLLIFPIFIINEILMIIYSAISGWFLLKIKSYFIILKLLLSEVKFRQKNHKNIQKNEKKLKKFIISEISFSELNTLLFGPYNVILSLYWKLVRLML